MKGLSVGLSLRNIRTKTQSLLSNRDNTNITEGFEEITEAMSERLADQIPEFLKRIDYLQKNKNLSQNNKIEVQKWIDIKNEELLNLKETIAARRQSYIETLSDDDRVHLAERHPIWMSDFNLHLDQIQDLMAIHKDGNTIIQFFLEAHIFRLLKIFYYGSDGNMLTIHSSKNVKRINGHVPLESGNNSQHNNVIDRPKGEYIFVPLPEGHAQWIFKGNRWGIDNNILWLDFGKSKDQERG